MNDTLVSRVVELAADIFDVPASELSATSTSDDVESWDSLALLNMMLALEDEFGVSMSPDDIGSMSSLGAIAELVASRTG